MNTLTGAQQELIGKIRDKMANELRVWILTPEALKIRAMKREDLPTLNSTLGRDIRNEFELWMPEHDITSIWHNGAAVDGDHPCHPDNFSFSVIERLWEMYQERKTESL